MAMLDPAVRAFAQATTAAGDLNPVRTDLLMRLVCLRAAGCDDVDYDTLVMLSGHGTSFAYHPKKYVVMYQPPDSPDDTERRLVEGTGFGWEWRPRTKDAELAWTLVTETLDAGRPCQGRWLDDYVFAGYRREPRGVYVLGGWQEPGWWDWDQFAKWVEEFGSLGRPTQPVARTEPREMTLTLLRRTVEWAEHDGRAGVDWMSDAKYGPAGMEAYAADVADLTKQADAFDAGWLGCHCLNRQTSGRRCAADWLRRVAPLIGLPAERRLLEAAEQYEREVAAWDEFRRCFNPGDGQVEADGIAAVWAVPANRTAGAEAARRAAGYERWAVEAIRAALEAAGD